MKLSAPIYRLKREAKRLSRSRNLRLYEALDRIASREGFSSWSLLSTRASRSSPARRLWQSFNQGDLVLLGARPGHGKTLLGLEIALEAMSAGHRAVFFSLEYNAADIDRLFVSIGKDPAHFRQRFDYDTSDLICADHIIAHLARAAPGTFAIVDYLQLLDQNRSNPALGQQVRALRSFAAERQLIMVFISQIDRSFDLSSRTSPRLEDVRLPNPVDLNLFARACFLHDGEIRAS